jgi:hypothetical protein
MLLVSLLFLASCGNDPLDIDISSVNIAPVRIQRFDQDFFALNADNIQQKLPELQKKYPGFTDLFIKNIVCQYGVQDSACIPEITKFVTDKDMRSAYDACQSVFGETVLKETESALTDVLRHHKYYFPEKPLPEIFSMMSGFNYSIATADTDFAIGLEKYLGRNSRFYEMLQVPEYKRFTMQKEFIAPDLARVWVLNEFPNQNRSGTLLSEMIYQGKILYLIDALMPETDDTLKIGFTKRQMAWCTEHEKDVWGHLVQNKFLYSNAVDVVTKFTGEGPFTTGFVKESPARTGVWIGWNIVRRFMKENPKTTLQQLMDEKDPQMILSRSKYKP